MPVVSNIKLQLLGVVIMKFYIRVVCLLCVSFMAAHALAQDLSGWSDKTVCRQTMETEYQGDYLLETKERQLDCREFYPDFNEGSNLPENISFARIDPTSISNYQQLLESRITINRFRPWFTSRDGFKGYQLYWGGIHHIVSPSSARVWPY